MSANRNIENDKALTRQLILDIDRPVSSGGENWLGHHRKTAVVDYLLLDGATLDKLQEQRGAINQHILHLRNAHGLLVIENSDSKLKFDRQHLGITPNNDVAIESGPTADIQEYIARARRIQTRGLADKPAGVPKPRALRGTISMFFRDPAVRAWVLQRAKGCCELCHSPAPFVTDDKEPFLESHHLIMLCEGGPDTPDNATALCPNCHRKLHHGIDRIELRERLIRIVTQNETSSGRSSNAVKPTIGIAKKLAHK